MIEIWGRRSSSNVQKVLWTAAELGLDIKRHTVGGGFGGTAKPAYRAMNPNGLVPVMQDGGITMFESNAIVRYLAARYGQGTLRPADAPELAMAEQWMEWQQTTAVPPISAIFWNNVRSSPGNRDAKAAAANEDKLLGILAIADSHLSRSTHFAGDRFTMADIVLGVLYWRYQALECRMPETPHLARWFESLKTRQPYRDWVMVPVGRNSAEWDANEKALG